MMSDPKHGKKIDRPYLTGYARDVLGIPDGAYFLGNMISNAETPGELLNYSPQDIVIATEAMMRTYSGMYLAPFLDTIHTFDDGQLWSSVITTFRQHAGDVVQNLRQKNQFDAVDRMGVFVEKYSVLRDIYAQALKAPVNETVLSQEIAPNPL